MVNAITDTPFKVMKGKHQFNLSGTGTATLSILTIGNNDPVLIELQAPSIWNEELLEATITAVFPSTLKLTVQNH